MSAKHLPIEKNGKTVPACDTQKKNTAHLRFSTDGQTSCRRCMRVAGYNYNP